MDDNVVGFPFKNVDPDIQMVQETLEEDDSDSIVIVYNNEEGKFSLVSSNPDPKEMLFNLEIAKFAVMSQYFSNSQMED